MIEVLDWFYQHKGFAGGVGFVICFCVFYFDIKIRIGYGKPINNHTHTHNYNVAGLTPATIINCETIEKAAESRDGVCFEEQTAVLTKKT